MYVSVAWRRLTPDKPVKSSLQRLLCYFRLRYPTAQMVLPPCKRENRRRLQKVMTINDTEKQQLIEKLQIRISDYQTQLTRQCALSEEERFDYYTCCFALAALTAPPVLLPYCSASPVCEIEAGYASGVNDCKEAIRRAGYPIEGDD